MFGCPRDKLASWGGGSGDPYGSLLRTTLALWYSDTHHRPLRAHSHSENTTSEILNIQQTRGNLDTTTTEPLNVGMGNRGRNTNDKTYERNFRRRLQRGVAIHSERGSSLAITAMNHHSISSLIRLCRYSNGIAHSPVPCSPSSDSTSAGFWNVPPAICAATSLYGVSLKRGPGLDGFGFPGTEGTKGVTRTVYIACLHSRRSSAVHNFVIISAFCS